MEPWRADHPEYDGPPERQEIADVIDPDVKAKLLAEATAIAVEEAWQERRIAFIAQCERNGWG